MFEDFKNLNYWKTPNKLRTFRELINRIDLPKMEEDLSNLLNLLDKLDYVIEENNEREKYPPPDYPTQPPYPPQVPPPQRPPGPTPPSELLPDLVVSSITTEDHTHYIDILIDVQNQGSAIAGSNALNVVIPGHSNINLAVPTLAVGASTTLHHQYAIDPTKPETTKTVIATADASNSVTESNETNNTTSTTFIAKEQPAGLIVHIHNPEGFEIGSIVDISDITLSHGIIATNEATHGQPTVLSPGNYTITATFNGMTLQQDISISAGQTEEIFFIFTRIDQAWGIADNQLTTIAGSFSGSHFDEAEDKDLLRNYVICSITRSAYGYGVGSYNISAEYDISSGSITLTTKINISGIGQGVGTWGIVLAGPAIQGWEAPFGGFATYTTFTSWYCQGITSGSYPTIYVRSVEAPGFPYTLFSGSYTKIPVNYTYNSIGVGGGILLKDLITISGLTNYSYNNEQELTGSLNSKISSVPYNLQGTAV